MPPQLTRKPKITLIKAREKFSKLAQVPGEHNLKERIALATMLKNSVERLHKIRKARTDKLNAQRANRLSWDEAQSKKATLRAIATQEEELRRMHETLVAQLQKELRN